MFLAFGNGKSLFRSTVSVGKTEECTPDVLFFANLLYGNGKDASA